MKDTLPKKRFSLTRPQCAQCVQLQEEIKRLRAENHRLKTQQRDQQRQIDEGYFGSSTPSAKKPFKTNTTAERNNGGGRLGHRGHGRALVKIQNIFRDHTHRLYHWAADRAIPADNNFAERELRKLVIARKLSFGSQSDAGAKTREVLMTTLLTRRKRKAGDVMANFKAALDELARDPSQEPYQILFPPNSS